MSVEVPCVTKRVQASNCHDISEVRNNFSSFNSAHSLIPFMQHAAQQSKNTFKNFQQLLHSSVAEISYVTEGQGAENRQGQHFVCTTRTYKAQKTLMSVSPSSSSSLSNYLKELQVFKLPEFSVVVHTNFYCAFGQF